MPACLPDWLAGWLGCVCIGGWQCHASPIAEAVSRQQRSPVPPFHASTVLPSSIAIKYYHQVLPSRWCRCILRDLPAQMQPSPADDASPSVGDWLIVPGAELNGEKWIKCTVEHGPSPCTERETHQTGDGTIRPRWQTEMANQDRRPRWRTTEASHRGKSTPTRAELHRGRQNPRPEMATYTRWRYHTAQMQAIT